MFLCEIFVVSMAMMLCDARATPLDGEVPFRMRAALVAELR